MLGHGKSRSRSPHISRRKDAGRLVLGYALVLVILAAGVLAACSTSFPAAPAAGQQALTRYPLEYEVEAAAVETAAAQMAANARSTSDTANARASSVAQITQSAIAATTQYRQTVSAISIRATEAHNALVLAEAQTELTRKAEAINVELTREAKREALAQLSRANDIAATRQANDLIATRQGQKNDLAQIRAIGWSIGIPLTAVAILSFLAMLFALREKTNRQAIIVAAETAALRDNFLETSYGPIFVHIDTTGGVVYRQIEPPPHLIPDVIEPESQVRQIPFAGRAGHREPVTVTDVEADPVENDRVLVTSLLQATIAWQRTNDGGSLVIPRWDQLAGWNSTSRASAVEVMKQAGLVDVVPSVGTKIRAGWISAERLLTAIEEDVTLLTSELAVAVPA